MNNAMRVQTLVNTLTHRITWFKAKIEKTRIGSPERMHGHVRLFELFDGYCSHIVNEIKGINQDNTDGFVPTEDLINKLRLLLTQYKAHHRAFDELFYRDSRDIPHSMSFFINEACNRWNLPDTDIILTVGPPGNFVTRSGSFWSSMFQGAGDSTRDIVSIAVPEHEGTEARWIPITLGHELGHHLLSHRQIDGIDAIESDIFSTLATARRLSEDSSDSDSFITEWTNEEVAHAWIEELVCDAYAVVLFGPAAVAANLEFLTSLGDPTKPTETHPPTCFRAELMLAWLKTTVGLDLGSFTDLLQLDLANEQPADGLAAQLCEAIRPVTERLLEVVHDWALDTSYAEAGRDQNVSKLESLFRRGIPGLIDSQSNYDNVDITNACWRASQTTNGQEIEFPIDRLASKAIEDLYFVMSWRKAGGVITPPRVLPNGSSQPGVLTTADFGDRINSDESNQIAITPLLPEAIGPASIDLRLSNKFIVFEQTSTAAFDAMQNRQDPRSMQSRVEKTWGNVFYLHPGQLVLAATLEYIVLPDDLCAQVVTRSSYGRLGLLSATAVQVHPGYKGCLTLELVNLGSMPLAITPGERVAQLMVFAVSSPWTADPDKPPKYECPTGPEFSKIKQDVELETLRNMRATAVERD